MKNRHKLRSRLTGPKRPGDTAHHVIDVDRLDKDLVQKALEGGFEFNGAENGMWAKQSSGRGHRAYSTWVSRQLARIDAKDLTPEQAAGNR
ncbi:AHH domain-containing protein [Salipiger abyssi]|uniref:AHH domain-containing protein n=1 Tax=Salipiger abyssi TaxID=1250539 RepID=UPI00405A043F